MVISVFPAVMKKVRNFDLGRRVSLHHVEVEMYVLVFQSAFKMQLCNF